MLAYFDCFSGISGDMTLGALLDLGVPLPWLRDQLAAMPLKDFRIDVQTVHRSGIAARQIMVADDGTPEARCHEDIKALIASSPLPESVKRRSLDIFRRLAVAEAGIHGCEVEAVHFHEVGATDAIVDIVGAALCLDYLKISEVCASRIPLGRGFVTCSHGRIPVPAPATLALLKNVPVYGTEVEAELVTPTGAAILTSLARSFAPQPPMSIDGIGYGAGRRPLEPGPNLLRVIVGRRLAESTSAESGVEHDQVWVLETCIDDMNPEILGYCTERLFEDGALDVCLLPVQMKKGRPGTLLQVICHGDRREVLLRCILRETTTLGVRYHAAERRLLAREAVTVKTSFGDLTLKKVRQPDGAVRLVPEYEECRRIAREKNLPMRQVYDIIVGEMLDKPGGSG